MRLRRRIVLRAGAVLLALSLLWLLWPLYGFVSHQFEVARSPFGWSTLPGEAPTTQAVHDSRYADAGTDALDALAERRQVIKAPSLSAAVAVGSEVVWAGVVGWADVERGHAATPGTTYRIGSTSKAVTATVLARLVAERRVRLDAPLGQYVSGLPNPAWYEMTARQLASHTAGVPNYEENTDWLGFYQSLALQRSYRTSTEALDIFDGSDLLYEPGTGFHYTSYGTMLLAAAMEQATGRSFAALVEQEVLSPLDLKSLRPDSRLPSSDPVAVFYQKWDGHVKRWRAVDLSSKTAAGGLVATPSDLAALGGAWLDTTYIPATTREAFWTSVRLPDGTVNEQDYALGWRRKAWPIEGMGSVVHLNHGGVSKGAQAWLMVTPDHGVSVALAMNARTDAFFDFADVYVDILEAFLPAVSARSAEVERMPVRTTEER